MSNFADMILNVIKAEYLKDYQISLTFDNGESYVVDLKETLKNDHRTVFAPLQNLDFFKNFKINFNTIEWPNEVDFAPEFLLELGRLQASKNRFVSNLSSINVFLKFAG